MSQRVDGRGSWSAALTRLWSFSSACESRFANGPGHGQRGLPAVDQQASRRPRASLGYATYESSADFTCLSAAIWLETGGVDSPVLSVCVIAPSTSRAASILPRSPRPRTL